MARLYHEHGSAYFLPRIWEKAQVKRWTNEVQGPVRFVWAKSRSKMVFRKAEAAGVGESSLHAVLQLINTSVCAKVCVKSTMPAMWRVVPQAKTASQASLRVLSPFRPFRRSSQTSTKSTDSSDRKAPKAVHSSLRPRQDKQAKATPEIAKHASLTSTRLAHFRM